nr:MAG: attachment glycoprotein [Jeilongvirus beilongi]WPV62387.1 MAG: attachment glycoprotein [Jeilongvirus beilongi]
MSQLAAHQLAMSNFYGTHQGGLSSSQKEGEQPVQGVIRYVSMIVGLLSLFTIIALNVTNIIYMTESGGTMQSIKNAQGSIDGSMKEISGTIMEDIKPKTDLINSMVSYNIPAQLSMIHQIIKNDVLKQCTPSFMFNNTICPLAENPTHSRYFEELNLDSISECSGNDLHLELGANPDFIEFPSFAPGSTRPGSCVRLPSFSLSSTVFAYTHTIMGHGCSELDVGDHYFAVGRIADAGHEIPQFETISSWFINDKINRRSCTVAAGTMDAWMGCVIMTETFYDDLNSLDTGKLTISYLDVFGRKKEWIYTRSEIQYDYTYTSAYFSIGSGVVVGDTVYFLIWGSLSSPIEENAYCFAPGCSNYNQRMCNDAQRPSKFGYRQMVNGILRFKTTSTGKPLLSVRTLSPSVIPFGTEGRLVYSEITKIIYLYLRSTSWHALPLTGLLVLGPPTSVSWVTQEAVSRPGEYPCGASNRCPKDCVTGVYTDLFPLGARFEYAATVFLNAETYRVNPTLAVINKTGIISKKKITTESQRAGYTTTTCFVFKLRIWCISVVELAPATMTAFEPIPFLYQLDLSCRTGNGSVAMSFSGSEGVYKTGRFRSPRNECFFEKVTNKYYFIVSTPDGIQPYEIRDLTPERMPHIIMYISDVCAPALNAFKKLLPAMRPITTLTIGNWQFRPVDIRGGLRVDIYRNKTVKGDQSMSAPEDPGSNTFPGGNDIKDPIENVGHYEFTYPNKLPDHIETVTPAPGDYKTSEGQSTKSLRASTVEVRSVHSSVSTQAPLTVSQVDHVVMSTKAIGLDDEVSGSGAGDDTFLPTHRTMSYPYKSDISTQGQASTHASIQTMHLETITPDSTVPPSTPEQEKTKEADHPYLPSDPEGKEQGTTIHTTEVTTLASTDMGNTSSLNAPQVTTHSDLDRDPLSDKDRHLLTTTGHKIQEPPSGTRANTKLPKYTSDLPPTLAPTSMTPEQDTETVTKAGDIGITPADENHHTTLSNRTKMQEDNTMPQPTPHQQLGNNTLNPQDQRTGYRRYLIQDMMDQMWNFMRGMVP